MAQQKPLQQNQISKAGLFTLLACDRYDSMSLKALLFHAKETRTSHEVHEKGAWKHLPAAQPADH